MGTKTTSEECILGLRGVGLEGGICLGGFKECVRFSEKTEPSPLSSQRVDGLYRGEGRLGLTLTGMAIGTMVRLGVGDEVIKCG